MNTVLLEDNPQEGTKNLQGIEKNIHNAEEYELFVGASDHSLINFKKPA